MRESRPLQTPSCFRILTAAGLVLLLATAPTAAETTESVPPDAVGHWKGESDVIVTWCEQETLPFDLTIHPDGSVSGSAGDAILTNGHFRQNHRILIWLGNSRYYIEADLDGPIVAPERIQRDSIRVYLDLEKDTMKGSFQTSGKKSGGKETMVMTGRSLTLAQIVDAGSMPDEGPGKG